MKQETQGRTDLYVGSWLKSQSRDKVLAFLTEAVSLLKTLWLDYFHCETTPLRLESNS